MAKLISESLDEFIEKHVDEDAHFFTDASREKLAKKGFAMRDGSFPIVTTEDLRNAIKAYGRAKNKTAAKEHIKKRARALGKSGMIPDYW